MPPRDEDDDLPDPSENDSLPPKFPGTWNNWRTTSRKKPAQVYNGRAAHKQLLTNEIGDYAKYVDRDLKAKILAAIAGKTWYEIPLIVHRMVCPECTPEGLHPLDQVERSAWSQPTLFGD